jgi:hypothetical protein
MHDLSGCRPTFTLRVLHVLQPVFDFLRVLFDTGLSSGSSDIFDKQIYMVGILNYMMRILKCDVVDN